MRHSASLFAQLVTQRLGCSRTIQQLQSREEAGGAAHKLAGSLGMYGYVEGTRIAREIEVLLLDEDRTRDLSRLGELAAELRQTIFPVDPA